MRTALAAVTLLLLASMGGGFLAAPLLVPLHVWAARRSGAVGRVLWSLFPVVIAAMVTWAATYLAVGEAKPAIWLGPALAAGAAAEALRRATSRTGARHAFGDGAPVR